MSKPIKPNAFNTSFADLPGGFKWLTGDASWDDYGGAWFKEGEPGVFYVIRYENGHEHDKELPRHMIEVKSVNIAEMTTERINEILSCCGYVIKGDEIVEDHAGDVLAKRGEGTWNHVIVEAALAHGACAPLDDFAGDTGLRGLIRDALRSARNIMKDERLRRAVLARPVNQIGSTAAEYARGDLASALSRGPYDAKKQLMRKIYGLNPFGPGEPHEVS